MFEQVVVVVVDIDSYRSKASLPWKPCDPFSLVACNWNASEWNRWEESRLPVKTFEPFWKGIDSNDHCSILHCCSCSCCCTHCCWNCCCCWKGHRSERLCESSSAVLFCTISWGHPRWACVPRQLWTSFDSLRISHSNRYQPLEHWYSLPGKLCEVSVFCSNCSYWKYWRLCYYSPLPSEALDAHRSSPISSSCWVRAESPRRSLVSVAPRRTNTNHRSCNSYLFYCGCEGCHRVWKET